MSRAPIVLAVDTPELKTAIEWVKATHGLISVYKLGLEFFLSFGSSGVRAIQEETDADILVWMDADTICHSPITMNDLYRMIPSDSELCYLGRKGKYSECGLYSMNLRSPNVQAFLKEFQRFYDQAEHGIFQLDEWHDSFIFDVVRRHTVLKELDWSSHLITGEGHPLINSAWGAYLDHLKGSRKKTGRSLATDLKVKRTEAYWQ
jgi:hypothetical protein